MTENYEDISRQNPFCVVAKEPWPDGRRFFQTNTGWHKNPYGDAYAIVPDNMVPAIVETQGYSAELILTDDGTEVAYFVAGDIPEPEPYEPPDPAPATNDNVWNELDEAYMEGVNGAYDE